MNDYGLASIVIPVHNEGGNVKKVIKSIEKNTSYKNYEIVVVSDSTDGCCDFLKNYKKAKVRLVRIKKGRVGPAKARNIGAEHIKGKIIVFMDAHVFPRSENWLSEIMAFFNKNKNAGICGPVISVYMQENAKGYGLTIKNSLFEAKWLPKMDSKPYEIPVACAICMAAKKDAFFEIGAFNENFGWGHEDVELCIRSWLFGHPVYLLPNVEVSHIFKRYHHGYDWDLYNNILKLGVMHFDTHTFKRVSASVEKKMISNGIKFKYSDVASKELLKRRKVFTRKRIHDINWFFRKFNIKI